MFCRCLNMLCKWPTSLAFGAILAAKAWRRFLCVVLASQNGSEREGLLTWCVDASLKPSAVPPLQECYWEMQNNNMGPDVQVQEMYDEKDRWDIFIYAGMVYNCMFHTQYVLFFFLLALCLEPRAVHLPWKSVKPSPLLERFEFKLSDVPQSCRFW